jgi:hypothetical protein
VARSTEYFFLGLDEGNGRTCGGNRPRMLIGINIVLDAKEMTLSAQEDTVPVALF